MTTWQAIISTSTPSPQIPAQTTTEGKVIFAVGSARSNPAFVSMLCSLAGHAAAAWKWLERKRTQQLSARRLRVTETIALGEKRFVSILQVDGTQFLIGGAAGNVSLLAILKRDEAASAGPSNAAIASVEDSL